MLSVSLFLSLIFVLFLVLYFHTFRKLFTILLLFIIISTIKKKKSPTLYIYISSVQEMARKSCAVAVCFIFIFGVAHAPYNKIFFKRKKRREMEPIP